MGRLEKANAQQKLLCGAWQGAGVLRGGANRRGEIMQTKPIPARDLKLEKTQPGGRNLNYKNLKV